MDGTVLNILVVDDDEAMRRLFFDMLSPLGHQIILATSAEEGLSQLPFFDFSVAFLDHNLPGMEGLVLGEYLKRHNAELEIALVTGDSSDRVQRLCDTYGISYVSKPFERSELVGIIDRAKQRRKVEPGEEDEVSLAPFPRITEYAEALPDIFEMPNAPQRLQDQLGWHIQEALSRMRLHGPSEADRTLAFAGLITARVLGLKLQRNRRGLTPWEDYDDVIASWGGAPMFSNEPD